MGTKTILQVNVTIWKRSKKGVKSSSKDDSGELINYLFFVIFKWFGKIFQLFVFPKIALDKGASVPANCNNISS